VSRGSTVTEIEDWLGALGLSEDIWSPDDLPETFYAGHQSSLPVVFDLTGKAALVTRAGGDLGREFAITLADAGATVVCADADATAATAIARFLRSRGAEAVELVTDLTDGRVVLCGSVVRAEARNGRVLATTQTPQQELSERRRSADA
jgi:ApbE superfamily uncharacterized protein (UPF0280 family)